MMVAFARVGIFVGLCALTPSAHAEKMKRPTEAAATSSAFNQMTGIDSTNARSPSSAEVRNRVSPSRELQEGFPTLSSIVSVEDDLSVCAAALNISGLVEEFAEPGQYTLFCPDDNAFSNIDDAILAFLLTPQWNLHLRDLLYFHVTGTSFLSGDLTKGLVLQMLNNEQVTVNVASGLTVLHVDYFDSSVVFDDDFIASNGVLHKIDTVLLPSFMNFNLYQAVEVSPLFSTLMSLTLAAGLEDVLTVDIVTVLSPWNEAFELLAPEDFEYLSDPDDVSVLRRVLLYHVVPGVYPSNILESGELVTLEGSTVAVAVSASGVRFNDANVVAADGLANNGIGHALGAVLIPSSVVLPTTSVVGVVSAEETLTTLELALIESGLVEILEGVGPFTVFAPIDAAFHLLDPMLLSRLLEPNWSMHLRDLLLYHVIAEELIDSDLVDGLEMITLNNENVTVNFLSGTVIQLVAMNGDYFDSSILVEGNLLGRNGVVHTVDSVFVPQFLAFDLFESLVASGSFSTVSDLLVTAGLVNDLESGFFMFFAPVDPVFESIPNEILDQLIAEENNEILVSILLYHVIPEVMPVAMLEPGEKTTLEGSNVTVSTSPSGIFVNDAKILATDGLSRNGIGHAIDSLLVPVTVTLPTVSPTADDQVTMSPTMLPLNATIIDVIVGEDDLTALVSVVAEADLLEAFTTLGDLTVFAPINSAFASLDEDLLVQLLSPSWILHLQDLLLFPVTATGALLLTDLTNGTVLDMINDESVSVVVDGVVVTIVADCSGSSSVVVEADFVGSNGVVHKVDAVLLPSFLSFDIMASLDATASFLALTSLIVWADLDSTLSSGTFTILAPVDSAFEALPTSVVDFLTDPINVDSLTTVLLYHVLSGVFPSPLLVSGSLTSVEGSSVSVSVTVAGVMFNDARVVLADVLSNNGLGHAIDGVLIPPTQTKFPSTVPSPKPTDFGSSHPSNAPSIRVSKKPTSPPSPFPSDSPLFLDTTKQPSMPPTIDVSFQPSIAPCQKFLDRCTANYQCCSAECLESIGRCFLFRLNNY